MRMLRRDVEVMGPRAAEERDVHALNRLFSDSFTDRYRRDGMVGVRVPTLNPNIWRYALRDAGPGAMLWHDDDGQIVAFNIVHYSGVEGWMGPLAVRTDRQGSGVGRLIVNEGVRWLKRHRTHTIGLETMPRTVDNIGFYSQLGFLPGHLTITMVGASRSPAPDGYLRVSALAPTDQDAVLDACRRRLERSVPGLDFTREHRLTLELDIGDVVVIQDSEVRGFALWHSAALVEARPPEELRLLKLFADSPETFDRLLGALEACAVTEGPGRVAVRCQTLYPEAYRVLVQRGYRVRWTDLRMTLAGFPGSEARHPEIMFSNWEI